MDKFRTDGGGDDVRVNYRRRFLFVFKCTKRARVPTDSRCYYYVRNTFYAYSSTTNDERSFNRPLFKSWTKRNARLLPRVIYTHIRFYKVSSRIFRAEYVFDLLKRSAKRNSARFERFVIILFITRCCNSPRSIQRTRWRRRRRRFIYVARIHF